MNSRCASTRAVSSAAIRFSSSATAATSWGPVTSARAPRSPRPRRIAVPASDRSGWASDVASAHATTRPTTTTTAATAAIASQLRRTRASTSAIGCERRTVPTTRPPLNTG